MEFVCAAYKQKWAAELCRFWAWLHEERRRYEFVAMFPGICMCSQEKWQIRHKIWLYTLHIKIDFIFNYDGLMQQEVKGAILWRS